MANMRVVKLTYRVTPHFIISRTGGKKNEYAQLEHENLL